MTVVTESESRFWASKNGGCSWCGDPATRRATYANYFIGDLLCEHHGKHVGSKLKGRVFVLRRGVWSAGRADRSGTRR